MVGIERETTSGQLAKKPGAEARSHPILTLSHGINDFFFFVFFLAKVFTDEDLSWFSEEDIKPFEPESAP